MKKSQEVFLLTLLGLALAGCGKKNSPKPLPKGHTAHCGSHKNAAEQRFVTARSNTENTVQEGLPSTSPTDTKAALETDSVVTTPQKVKTDTEAVKALVDSLEKQGRLEEALKKTYARGRTLLHIAAAEGTAEQVKILAKAGADVNAKDINGYTPLILAAQRGNAETVKALLDSLKSQGKCKKALKKIDDWGRTALHLAAEEGHALVVEQLIGEGAKVDTKDRLGRTPLMLAAQYGHEGAVKVLVDSLKSQGKCKKALKKIDDWGRTALHLAAEMGHAEVVKSLIDAEADVNKKNRNWYTPLHYAAGEGHAEVVKSLIDAEADVNAKDDDKWTPLHCATCKGDKTTVELLIKKKADVHAKNVDKSTPLHYAAGEGHTDVIGILIKEGAKVNTKNKKGWTPLHYAAQKGHVEAIEKLLSSLNAADRAAVLAVKDKKGWTALAYAKDDVQAAIASLLQGMK